MPGRPLSRTRRSMPAAAPGRVLRRRRAARLPGRCAAGARRVARRVAHLVCAHGNYRSRDRPTIELPDDEGYVKGASTTSTASGRDPTIITCTNHCSGGPAGACDAAAGTDPASQTDARAACRAKSPAGDRPGDDGAAAWRSVQAGKGTLPRLRFGQLYRFRAGVVDLAGNSLTLDDRSLDKMPGHEP